MTTEPIRIEGLKEFQRGLKQLDSDMPKALRLAMNDSANIIVEDARPRVPSVTGKAKRSVKARSTQTKARVVGGGNKVPYYPWLDFGGRVGRRKSVRRPVLADGRYIYNAYFRKRGEFVNVMQSALVQIAHDAGIEVS